MFFNFTALAAGIPFLPPYLDQDTLNFRGHGKNFAVAGSTASPKNLPAKTNISISVTRSSLNVQLDWMSTYMNRICHNADG